MKIHAFTDNLDVIDNGLIVVKARVEMIAENQGGRHGPFSKGYRPNHNLDGEGNAIFYIGDVEPEKSEWIYPGQSENVIVRFLNVRGLREKLEKTKAWRIQEGRKLVGIATISEIQTQP